MNKLNKIVSNYPVSLSEDEVANLSSTLLPVIEACGGGGGGGITQYYGDGTYTEITGSHVITLTNETKQKINRTIPTKVTDLTDSANYQTVEEMAGYETTQHASQTYLTKSSADTLYAPLSTTADVEALKAVSGDFSQYYTKNETYSKNEVYTKEDVYQKTETSSKSELSNAFIGVVTDSELETAIGNVNVTINNLQDTVAGKQDILTFGKDGTGAISSINSTALAGQGGTTYSAGQYINIDANDTISVTGLMALDEYAQYEPVLIGDSNITATSSKVDSHTQWNLRINATPVTTDTTLKGENVVTAHTTNVSGEWAVGLVQSAYEAIDSVGGIATDVGTLKTASANWNKVSDKLDTTAFSTVSGNFLTAHQSLDDYATKSDINDMATKTWVGQQGYLTSVPDTYATKNDLNTASSTLTGVDSALSGHIDYVSAHAITNLDDYYTKTEVDSTFASATQLNDYLTTAKYHTDSGTFALKTEIPTTVAQLTDSGNYYQKTDTSSNTEITNALNTKVDKPTSIQTGKLVYDGDTSAWVSLPAGTTIIVEGQGSVTANYNSSNSTYTVSLLASAENALTGVSDKIDTTAVAQTYQTKEDMTNYLTTSDAANTYQPKGNYAPETVTATVNTLTGASASWNEVSAKLGTAQYATDSATFVTKPDTTQTVLNNNYLIYSTLTDPTATTGWMPLSANYYSKTESDGRYAKASAALTSVSANTPLSGNGTTANPLGIDLTNAYTIDGTNGITAVPNSNTNKVVVQMTNDVWADTQVVHSSISAWNEVSGLSAKSTVSANTATNVISISANSTATTANISATTYYTNTADSNLVAQRLFVVHNDDDLVAHVQAGLCQGQGSLFFVMSGFNS